MKNKMGFRHKFVFSFFDFTAYKEFLAQGLGKSVLYIFLVTLIFSTLTNFKTIDTFNSQISDIHEVVVNKVPSFEFKNGQLSMDSTEPFYYKHNGDMLIIDTVDKTDTSALNQYNNGIYINSSELVYRQNYTTIYTVDFSEYSDINLTNSSIAKILLILKIILPVILLIVNPIVSFLVNLAAVFIIIGPMSLLISSIMGIKSNYATACTLGFYSITLPLLLEALINISGIEINNFIVIFYIISIIYCYLALKEIKNTDKSNINLTH
ncbi:DUF1189 domain-containing protein [Clostridium saccharoperbutylacetonicum]|uniref:DUF1189 domain-containing protein n=1 Tax=Clostridium saccharoperbutylacetonicum TaxID=36745 RepID=UPI0039EA141D